MEKTYEGMDEAYKQIQKLAAQSFNQKPSYYETARKNENVFRNVLKDLRDNSEKRPVGFIIPKDLETEVEFNKLFEKHYERKRKGMFTITNFIRDKNIAGIVYQNSGVGAELEYFVNEDNSVTYKESNGIFMNN